MTSWQLQEAKNKLSQVVADAMREGPQVITRHGQEVVVVLSIADYRKLAVGQPRLSEFFRDSPLAGEELDLGRDRSPLRDATGL